MNKYSFMIVFNNDLANEPVFIRCEAEDWDEPVQDEKFINGFAKHFLENYLAQATCMRGKPFNPKRHSPRKLYEALLNNPEWDVVAYGVNCELPDNLLPEDDLPDGAIA